MSRHWNERVRLAMGLDNGCLKVVPKVLQCHLLSNHRNVIVA
jgi:hypothetical protein